MRKSNTDMNNLFLSRTITDREFKLFSGLIYKKTGINLHDGKKQLLQSRVNKILRKRNIPNYEEYFKLVVADKTDKELINLINHVSTNVTHFFREEKHFEFMRNIVAELKNQLNYDFKVWSAACSSGEEPYSIAIELSELSNSFGNYHITASDISTEMLQIAKKGIYTVEKGTDIPISLKKKYFKKGKGNAVAYMKVKDILKKQIKFMQINLINDFFFDHQFDIIFCRNVMIYFDVKTKNKIINKFYQYIKKGGYLFIGHSESLNGMQHNFKYVAPAIYRKISD